MQGVAGALALAALLVAAAPAQALAPRGAEAPPWALAWQAVLDLWNQAQEALGLRPVAAADEGDPATNGLIWNGGKVTAPPAPGGNGGNGDQGSGVDPDG
jgi:hypothetical protein